VLTTKTNAPSSPWSKLGGQNLKAWCERGAAEECQESWIDQFKEAVYESLSIVARFHRHGIILIDFKPDNIIRLTERAIKFVDLGAFFTPRHYGAIDRYVYSATPDYAELLIDALNVRSDCLQASFGYFRGGVALFEMATGSSAWKSAERRPMKSWAIPPSSVSAILKSAISGSPIRI
jgi:serine/threonine protein kinase